MKWKFLLSLTAVVLLTGLLGQVPQNSETAASAQSAGPAVYLPLVFQGSEQPPADEASSRISLPPGFSIRIFASVSGTPRLLTVGPDGWIYAANASGGTVVRLPDRDGNGVADRVETAASDLNRPHNVEWRDGWMYVAQLGRIDRLADSNNDGTYETRELVTDNIPGSGGHSSRTLHFGPDGKLYVTAGSTGNIEPETDPRRAAMLRFNPDGSIPADNPFANDPDPRKRPLWAWGLRNSVDFLWTPTGALWANQNGPDGLGDNIPPEEIIIPIQPNRSYGWPYCYTPVQGLNVPAQPEVRDTRVSLPGGFTCDQAVPALLTDQAHVAPLGMSLAARSTFPAEYRDDIFVAYHGSWNTTSASYRDCKVQRVVIENGAVIRSETFANGWRADGKPCGDPASWGRPAGIVFGSDGALYISDDTQGRIFRVTYTGR